MSNNLIIGIALFTILCFIVLTVLYYLNKASKATKKTKSKYDLHLFQVGDEHTIEFPPSIIQTPEYLKKYQNLNSAIRGFQKRTGTKFTLRRVMKDGEYVAISYKRIS